MKCELTFSAHQNFIAVPGWAAAVILIETKMRYKTALKVSLLGVARRDVVLIMLQEMSLLKSKDKCDGLHASYACCLEARGSHNYVIKWQP